MKEYTDKLLTFLEKFPMPGPIIFAKIWGSRSHNTHKETSDWDYAGVYICSVSKILSLCPPEETKKHDKADSPEANKDENPDYQFHEIGKFCALLMKGNPAILEMLYTDRMCIETEAWLRLKKIRDKFLSAEAVHQYLGYMNGQLQRLRKGQSLHTKGGEQNEKWMYHILRLAGDAKRIAQGQPPEIWKEGVERDFLMKVRNNEYTWEAAEKLLVDAVADVEAQRPFKVPPMGDIDALNDWLIQLRKENW